MREDGIRWDAIAGLAMEFLKLEGLVLRRRIIATCRDDKISLTDEEDPWMKDRPTDSLGRAFVSRILQKARLLKIYHYHKAIR